MEIQSLIQNFINGDKKALARCITIVENELEGSEIILSSLKFNKICKVVGVTGPPGAGKSTLINALIQQLSKAEKKVGVIAIDPTSPFNLGSLLGDRLRMADHFNDENVFIRSLATRGALGGLSAKTIEVSDVMRAFGFDYLIVETVGVGQSEVEVAGLADTTVLVLVPESGDEVQAIKSGIMEIADIYVVNKADRDGANLFMKNIIELVKSKHSSSAVISCIATKSEGIEKLVHAIDEHHVKNADKRVYLLAEKAYRLIQSNRMKDIDKKELIEKIKKDAAAPGFNLYSFVKSLYDTAK